MINSLKTNMLTCLENYNEDVNQIQEWIYKKYPAQCILVVE